MGNQTGWGAEVALLWEPAEVSAADLATSGRRLTAQTRIPRVAEGPAESRRQWMNRVWRALLRFSDVSFVWRNCEMLDCVLIAPSFAVSVVSGAG